MPDTIACHQCIGCEAIDWWGRVDVVCGLLDLSVNPTQANTVLLL